MKKLAPVFLIAAAVTPCLTASAGFRQPAAALSINMSTLTASGMIGSVRSTGGGGDYLDCQIAGDFPPGSRITFAQCDAQTGTKDQNGQIHSTGNLSCISLQPSIIAVVQSIHSDSLVSFSTSSDMGCLGQRCCTSVSVYNGSPNAVLQP
jgi:hypothetical protein